MDIGDGETQFYSVLTTARQSSGLVDGKWQVTAALSPEIAPLLHYPMQKAGRARGPV
jgi:hypothetical protein